MPGSKGSQQTAAVDLALKTTEQLREQQLRDAKDDDGDGVLEADDFDLDGDGVIDSGEMSAAFKSWDVKEGTLDNKAGPLQHYIQLL